MNLYQRAQQIVMEKTIWTSGESIKLFENSNNNVYLKISQHGSISMFITVNNDMRKNAKVANIQLNVGYPGQFQCSEQKYQMWSKKIQEVL